MASILPSPDSCCSPCCEVLIVDLPSGGGGSGTGVNFYDTVAVLRQESRVTILVDDMPAQVYDRPNNGAVNSGFYFYDASSTASDDDTSVIKPDSVAGGSPGRWIKWKG